MTQPDEPTDADLLAAAARGEESAFTRFAVRHQATVFRYARIHVGDSDAEDVLQETFLAAWRSAATAIAQPTARPWLLTIARHALARLRRRPAGAGGALSIDEVPLDELGAAAGFAADDATPERFAAALEERELVHAAMAALEPDDREVLLLRDIEQLTGEEVATALGLTLAAMKSRLHRARLRFVAEVRRRLPEENRA